MNIIYLAAGGSSVARLLIAAYVPIGGHAAAWVIEALETDTQVPSH